MHSDIDPEATVADLVGRFRLLPRLAHLVLVNGVYVAPEARIERRLAPSDALAIWPPVAGG